MSLRVPYLLALLVAIGCASHGASPTLPTSNQAQNAAAQSRGVQPGAIKPGAIQHVVIIIQENRSFDNLFKGYPGADTQGYGYNHLGQKVTLTQVAMVNGYEPAHGHSNFVTEADYSGSIYKMDGFDLSPGGCYQPSCLQSNYVYVQQSDTANYWALAKQFALADHAFQPNMGPSWSAHQYLIAGQDGGYSPTHDAFYTDPTTGGSCYPHQTSNLPTIDMTSNYPGSAGSPQPTCSTYATILDELDTAGITWKYYARAKQGYWTAPPEFESLYKNDSKKVVYPNPIKSILADITSHKLAQVSYVTPIQAYSDHPGQGLTNHGQDFVATITNAIGGDSYYWPNTVVILMWDDWGGFYDHVPPPHAANPAGGNPNPNEYGMRVPFLVIGPYVIHRVDHRVRSTDAILGFIETVFKVPSLGTLDTLSDNLATMFNFTQQPIVYTPLPTHGWTPPPAGLDPKLGGGEPDTDMEPGGSSQ